MSFVVNSVSASSIASFVPAGSAPRSAGNDASVPTGAPANGSFIVTVDAQAQEPLTYSAAPSSVHQAWLASATDDVVSKQIANNFSASTRAQRLSGLGAALLNGYKGEAVSYRQALLSFSGLAGSLAAERGQQAADIGLQAAPGQKVSLTLKTQSGATVELSISSNPDALGVELKSSQTLSGNELKAVRSLADGFETAIKGLTEVPPRIAIDALTRFDSRAIASLDLRASFSKESGEPLALAFSATATGRSLRIETKAGALDLSVDLSNSQIYGDSSQKAKAVNNYLAQFDAAAKRGNGDKALLGLFKNAFSEMHAYYPEDGNAVGKRPLRDSETAVLSGLADFNADIQAMAVASNPMRLGEVDYFNYRTVQETKLVINGAHTRLSQMQEAVLEAAFHKELQSGKVPMLSADPRSQNYRYFQVSERISSKISLEHDALGPVQAELEQASFRQTEIKTYMRGKLSKEEVLPEQDAVILDLLDEIANLSRDPAERQRQLDALNDRVQLKS